MKDLKIDNVVFAASNISHVEFTLDTGSYSMSNHAEIVKAQFEDPACFAVTTIYFKHPVLLQANRCFEGLSRDYNHTDNWDNGDPVTYLVFKGQRAIDLWRKWATVDTIQL